MERRKIIPIVSPDLIIIKANKCFKKSKREKYGRNLELSNRNKEPSDRYDEEWSECRVLFDNEVIPHP